MASKMSTGIILLFLIEKNIEVSSYQTLHNYPLRRITARKVTSRFHTILYKDYNDPLIKRIEAFLS